jgi:hypothetical protein
LNFRTFTTLSLAALSTFSSFADEEFAFIVEPAYLQTQHEVQVNLHSARLLRSNENYQHELSVEYGLTDQWQVEVGYAKQEDILQLALAYDITPLFELPFALAVEVELENGDERSIESALLLSYQWHKSHTLHANLLFESEDDDNEYGVSIGYNFALDDELAVLLEYEAKVEDGHSHFQTQYSLGMVYELFDDGLLGFALVRSDAEEVHENHLMAKFSIEF